MEPAKQLRHLKAAAELARVDIPEFALPEDRQLTLRGVRFHYLDWGGSEARPTILFLHGRCQTAHTWDLVCLALRTGYRCLALDQRGHGDTAWSPDADYSADAMRADIEAFVDELGLERFILTGMSMGCLNSIGYASRHSDRLMGLVLVGASPDVQADGVSRFRNGVAKVTPADSLENLIARMGRLSSLPAAHVRRWSAIQNARQLPTGEWTVKYDPDQLHGELDQFVARRRELWEQVPSIHCPTLVVRGAHDRFFSDEQIERLAEALPNGRWERIEDAGHTVQEDAPAALVELMRGFLEEIGV